jgi:hypothetical protein
MKYTRRAAEKGRPEQLGLYVAELVGGEVVKWVDAKGKLTGNPSQAATFAGVEGASLAGFGLSVAVAGKWYTGTQWQQILDANRNPL